MSPWWPNLQRVQHSSALTMWAPKIPNSSVTWLSGYDKAYANMYYAPSVNGSVGCSSGPYPCGSGLDDS